MRFPSYLGKNPIYSGFLVARSSDPMNCCHRMKKTLCHSFEMKGARAIPALAWTVQTRQHKVLLALAWTQDVCHYFDSSYQSPGCDAFAVRSWFAQCQKRCCLVLLFLMHERHQWQVVRMTFSPPPLPAAELLSFPSIRGLLARAEAYCWSLNAHFGWTKQYYIQKIPKEPQPEVAAVPI